MYSIVENSKGLSLVEVAVAMGLTTILSGVIGYTFLHTTKSLKNVELKITAQNIGTQIENTISHTDGVLAGSSLSGNGPLEACLKSAGVCDSSTESDFFLYMPPPGNHIIAGTDSLPVRYNRQGSICQDQSQATESCLFIAKTSFKAHCSGGAATCSQADSITVGFQIEIAPSLQDNLSLSAIKPRSGSFVIQRDQSTVPPGSVTVSCPNSGEFISEIRSDGSVVCRSFLPNGVTQACPAGQKVTGINQDGTVICSNPLVQSQSCPNANEKVVEVFADGSIRCELSLPPNQSCQSGEQISRIRADGSIECGNIIPAGQDCPPGQRITEIRSTGEVVCGDVLPAGGSCPAGQVVSQILPDGSVTCATAMTASNRCPAGQRVIRVNASGSVACSNILAGRSANCGAGKYAQGVNALGDVICRNVPTASPTPPAPPPGPTTSQGSCLATINNFVGGVGGPDGGSCEDYINLKSTKPHGTVCNFIDWENGSKDWFSCTNGRWVYIGKSST